MSITTEVKEVETEQVPVPAVIQKKTYTLDPDLKAKLAAKSTGVAVHNKSVSPVDSFSLSIESMGSKLQACLPKHIPYDRFIRSVYTLIRTTPKLLECDRDSLLAQILLSAQLGLDLEPTLGLAYIIPRGGFAQFQFGYQGFIDLMYRSGEIADISSEIIYKNDQYDYKLGSNRRLDHIPTLDKDRSEVLAVYLIIKFKSHSHDHIAVMTKKEVDRIRDHYSKTADNGPWLTAWDEMAKKTLLRREKKWIPMSADLRRMLNVDQTIKRHIRDNMFEEQDNERDPFEASEVSR